MFKPRVRKISDYLYPSTGAKICKLLLKRDQHAFNGQSFLIFTITCIMHTACIKLNDKHTMHVQEIKTVFLTDT